MKADMTSAGPNRLMEACESLLSDCDYPNHLFVIREGIRGKFMCQRIGESEKWAVTAYESEDAGLLSIRRSVKNGVRDGVSGQVFPKVDLEMIRLTFDEARNVARSRPLPVVGLMIHLDDGRSMLHYVR